MRRNQWSAGALAVLLFGGGAAVGALGHRYYAASTVLASDPADDYRHRFVSDMKSRLGLSPAQVDQLEDILDATKSRFRAARETCRPAIANIKQEQIAQVKAILTPRQIPLYDQLVAERERRAKEQELRQQQLEAREAAARRAVRNH
jgi:hypothetical protein